MMNNSPLPTFDSIKKHPLVWSVIAISCFSYFLLAQHGLDALHQWFMPTHLIELFSINNIWRLWSPTFIHYTFLHLLTNIYLWWLFASKIENESPSELAIVCVVTAACANALQWWATGPNFGGLSGVTYALLGYLWVLEHYAGMKQYHVDRQLAILLIILIPITATGAFGQFATIAHIGGLICGVLMATIQLYKRHKSQY